MGIVQLRQIKSHLIEHYCGLFNAPDCSDKNTGLIDDNTLSRSLAAFSLVSIAGIDIPDAVDSITDGYNDWGIDGIYFSHVEKTLYLTQAKWSKNGARSIDQASVEKFIRGVRYLLNLEIDKFNEKIVSQKSELEKNIPDAQRIELILVHSSAEKLGEHPSQALDEFMAELNDTGEVAGLRILSQHDLHNIVAQGGQHDPVNLSIQLFSWGQTKEPYTAFYGQVAASDVASWGQKYRYQLYKSNIRAYLGRSTEVNLGISETIKQHPENFWYLNNGITALCSSIKKKPVGGASHDAGTFDCENVTIVNGAQTVGSLTELTTSLMENLVKARVPIRLISLENCPPEFSIDVTRATNTQNRVSARNFVALDRNQERIRKELVIDGIEYEYQQSEVEPSGESRFGLVEATLALACSSGSVDITVQAKREISKLWEDINRPPYKLMFRSDLTGLKLWHLVKIHRKIEESVESMKLRSGDPKDHAILINLNRLIEMSVFSKLDLKSAGESGFVIDGDQVDNESESVFTQISANVKEMFPDSYLASLAKNASKCKEIVE